MITTEGVCLDAGRNGQIARLDIVRDGWNAGSTAQAARGFPGTPPSAIVHAFPEFIWGMSVCIYFVKKIPRLLLPSRHFC